jgi:uracil-DNA glycosylase
MQVDAQNAVQALVDHLRGRLRQGQSHLYLTPEARDALRGLQSLLTLSGPRPAAKAISPTSPSPQEKRVTPGYMVPPHLAPEGATAEDKIVWLEQRAAGWEPAGTLGTLRHTLVFSTGSARAKIVLVGEAPGAEEERQREPFVGPAGQKLNQILRAMGLRREETYITNLCKFRPAIPGEDLDRSARNRQPTHQEMKACLPLLLAELAVIRPQVIVALGATAAKGLLDDSRPVGTLRQLNHQFEGVPVIVTYHPSFILRSESSDPDRGLSAKRKLWLDMLRAMEILGMPINEQQRGFFQS